MNKLSCVIMIRYILSTIIIIIAKLLNIHLKKNLTIAQY